MAKFQNIWNKDIVEMDDDRDKKIINVLRRHPDWRELINL